MQFTQVAEWLAWLEQRRPNEIDLGLDRVKTVLNRLDLPTLPAVITVAGTNGKGSCVAFLEAIYQAAGYKTGVYTSPHLLRYNERIRINSVEISDENLCRAFDAVNQVSQDILLTYFEMGTLAALYEFSRLQLDVLMLEVGLGGRLDAVNCISPNVSVITTIDLDHMHWLGDTREKIGKEKAGIFRPETPAICGDFSAPQSILHTAKQLKSPLFLQGQEFGYRIKKSQWEWWGGAKRLTELPLPALPVQNAATALMAIQQLANLPVSNEHIVKGLKSAKLAGRYQKIAGQSIETILDVAHNPQSVDYLARKLSLKPASGATIAVCAMLNDKDSINSLRPLIDMIDQWYFADLPAPRGQHADVLAKQLSELNAQASYDCHLTPALAYQAAVKEANPQDRIVVFGSFLTVADVLNFLKSLSV